MDERADIVVAGAGHNSLIAACYLAKAGYRCLVLDARHVPGGGATTEEILLPGYGIDTCATGHTLIRVNPLLTGDELGLIGDYGLRYIDPDPVAHVAFPDGEQLTMWLDRDRTAAEIARFSAADAAAYLRLLDEYDEVKSVFSGSQFTPVGFGPSLDARLAEHPRGRLWQRRRALSAWDVIRHEFASRHVRAFMLWMAFQTNQAVDVPGSGVLAYSLIFGRQQRSWSILAGGSGRLAEALTGYLHSHGSSVLCDKRVTRLLLDGDRCVGVETADGGQYRAGKAVLSTIHVTQLRDMAPARSWPEEFHYGIDTYDVGIPGFGVYLATSAPPEFAAADGGSQTAVSAGTVGWPEGVIRLGQDLRAGRFVADVPWLLVATPTLADPIRAPSGKHTVKLLSQQVYELPAGMPGWDVVKARHAKRQLEHLRLSAPGFTDDVILAQLVKSPADYEQLNLHMVHGAFHGGDRGVAQTGPLRPVPGWASHRMPIAGLYQTGATTHPGGSITGAPGRNAAMVLLHDLGHDPAEVMSALPSVEVRGGGGPGWMALARRPDLPGGAGAVMIGGMGTSADAGDALTGPGPTPYLPEPTGPGPVGTTSLCLKDVSRPDPWAAGVSARELMVSLWYPAAPSDGRRARYMTPAESELQLTSRGITGVAPDALSTVRTNAAVDATPAGRQRALPLVVLSPGFTSPRSTLTALAEDLASHGYVVAGIDHTYESFATAFPDGRVTTCLARQAPRRGRGFWEKVVTGRAADVCFVLGELTGAHRAWPGAGLIDPSRMAMAGHSAGGAAAIAAMLADSRIRAGIDMDGATYAPIPDHGLSRPFLFLGKQSNYTPGAGGAVTTWERDWKLLTGWKRWLLVAGTVHASFTDLALLADQIGIDIGAALPGARSLDITRAHVRAFFDQHLGGRPQALLDQPSPRYPEVTFCSPG